MTTPIITPKVTYSNVIEATPYSYNVPVASESEIQVDLIDGDGNDISADIDYTLSVSKSMGALLFDTNSIEITWTGSGSIPATNTLIITRKTSELQGTVFEFNADLSEETALEVDRLTRFQQDTNDKLDDIDAAIEEIEGNINPLIIETSIDDGAVTTPKIADGNVTEAKIADASITTSKLGSTSVTAAKLAANAVTSTKILNGAVSSEKLADSSVTEAKLVDSSVSTDKLVDESVTEAKLAQDVLDKFDQNIPLRLSVSTFSSKRVRIEAADIPLEDLTRRALGTGKSLITFDGLEIDMVTGNTYSLSNVLVGSNVYTFPTPSTGQYRTYLIEAAFGAVNSVGKTPLIISVTGGQENASLGSQTYPELSENLDLAIGYVTVQESGGSIADLVNPNLISLDSGTTRGESNNIHRIRVASHTFNVGDALIPVYWNGSAWVKADGDDVTTLATHLVLRVLSATEFTLAYSGRIFFPSHGLNIGAYYFQGEDTGVLSIIETADYSNPMLQVEDENYFTLLGWRANEKSVTTDVTGVETIIVPNLVSSTPTIFVSNLVEIRSIQVYNTTRKLLSIEDVEVRIDDAFPNRFTLFSSSNWADLRVDLIGVK